MLALLFWGDPILVDGGVENLLLIGVPMGDDIGEARFVVVLVVVVLRCWLAILPVLLLLLLLLSGPKSAEGIDRSLQVCCIHTDILLEVFFARSIVGVELDEGFRSPPPASVGDAIESMVLLSTGDRIPACCFLLLLLILLLFCFDVGTFDVRVVLILFIIFFTGSLVT